MKLTLHQKQNPKYIEGVFGPWGRTGGRTPEQCEPYVYELRLGEQVVDGLLHVDEARFEEVERRLDLGSDSFIKVRAVAKIEVELERMVRVP